MKRVLVACEFSAIVRDAFRARGFDAWSCDTLPTEGDPAWHYECDIFDVLGLGWDLMIAHPPCTYLANSGNKHLYLGMKKENGRDPERWRLMADGAAFFSALLNAPIEHIAVENPIMSPYGREIIGRPQDQVVQPWQFGHGETKATCFWLKNLPKLVPTNIVEGREARVHMMSPGPQRWYERSRTFHGIASAMADQWGAAL